MVSKIRSDQTIQLEKLGIDHEIGLVEPKNWLLKNQSKNRWTDEKTNEIVWTMVHTIKSIF